LEERLCVAIDGADIVPENFQSINAILGLLARYGAAA